MGKSTSEVAAAIRLVPIFVSLGTIVAIAVLGIGSGFSFAAAQPAEASIQGPARSRAASVDMEKLTGPLRTPLQATSAITGGNTSIMPNEPGVVTQLQLAFTVSAPLFPGTGEVVVTLDDDFQMPATLDRNQITINTTEVINSSDGCNPTIAFCALSDAVAPQSVSIDFVGPENDEPEISLLVPDMLLGTFDPALGSQGIAGGSTVTVVFQRSAGIRNSTEAGFRSIRVRTSAAADNTDVHLPDVAVPMSVQLSRNGGPRNESVELIALGVEGGTNVTFWLDRNGDGHRPNEAFGGPQNGEQDLCSAVASSSDIATCSFRVSNPPFAPGLFAAGGSCTAGAMSGCNFVNARDGDVTPRTTGFPLALAQAAVDRQNFEIQPTLEVSTATVRAGERVIMSLFDYPPGDTVTAAGVTIGGVSAAIISPSVVTILPNGQANFTLTVPAGAGQGVQKINVESSSGAEQDASLTLLGATLAVSHPRAVANQNLTITGSGFSEGAGHCILQRLITLNNIGLRLDENSVDSECADNPGPGDVGVLLSSGGTFTATVQVVAIDGSIPSALLDAGSKELKVIDSNGIEGSVEVTIAERTLNMVPLSAGPEDTITVIGTGFPASNPGTGPVSVAVEYDCGGGIQITVVKDPDDSGRFRAPLRIPTNCGIPSTNTVRAAIGFTNTVESVIHRIPAAVIRVEPSRGPSGSLVSVYGEGFRKFQPVDLMEFGGQSVLGSRNITTNESGDFSIDGLVVPGLPVGVFSVVVRVGNNLHNRQTADTSFEVITAPADISVSPWSITLGLDQGNTSAPSLSISNDGEVPLEFEIAVADNTSLSLGPTSAHGTSQPRDWSESADKLSHQREEWTGDSAPAPVEIQGIPLIHLVKVLSDPEGDASGAPPLVDILGVAGGFNQDVLTLSATFSPETDMNNLVGYIHLDTDQDPATGFAPAAQFGNADQYLGADFFLSLFTLPSLGVIGVFDQDSNFITDVVPVLQDQSLQVSIPLSALGGDDGRVNLTMVAGNNQAPTDWAPDSGHARIGPVPWVTASPSAGTVAGGGSTVVAVTFDATGLGPGVFTANLIIQSNDPDRGTVSVPLTMTVTSNDVVVVRPVVEDTLFSGSTFLARVQADEVGHLAHARANLIYNRSLFTFLEARSGAEFGNCLSTILPGQGQVQLELDCADGHSGVNISLWTLRFEAAVVPRDRPARLTTAGVNLSDSRAVPQELPSRGGVARTVIRESTTPAVPSQD